MQIFNPASCDRQNLIVASCDGKFFRVSYQSASGYPPENEHVTISRGKDRFPTSIFIGDGSLVFGFSLVWWFGFRLDPWYERDCD